MERIIIGKLGEKIATQFLIKNDWIILINNYRMRGDEIDIVARDKKGTLVFIEVKTLVMNNLSTFDTLMPEDNLTQAKLRKLKRVCEFFSRKYPHWIHEDIGWRIDLIVVELFANGEGVSAIRHYENI